MQQSFLSNPIAIKRTIKKIAKAQFASFWFTTIIKELGELFHQNVQANPYSGYTSTNFNNTTLVIQQIDNAIKK
jgi:hypothetical protein